MGEGRSVETAEMEREGTDLCMLRDREAREETKRELHSPIHRPTTLLNIIELITPHPSEPPSSFLRIELLKELLDNLRTSSPERFNRSRVLLTNGGRDVGVEVVDWEIRGGGGSGLREETFGRGWRSGEER